MWGYSCFTQYQSMSNVLTIGRRFNYNWVHVNCYICSQLHYSCKKENIYSSPQNKHLFFALEHKTKPHWLCNMIDDDIRINKGFNEKQLRNLRIKKLSLHLTCVYCLLSQNKAISAMFVLNIYIVHSLKLISFPSLIWGLLPLDSLFLFWLLFLPILLKLASQIFLLMLFMFSSMSFWQKKRFGK